MSAATTAATAGWCGGLGGRARLFVPAAIFCAFIAGYIVGSEELLGSLHEGSGVLRGEHGSGKPTPGAIIKTYVPSAFEQRWYNNIRSLQDSACATLAGPEQFSTWQSLVNALVGQEQAINSQLPGDVQRYASSVKALGPAVLSRMEYRDAASNKLLYTAVMEPLAGILRDPRTPCWSSKWAGRNTGKSLEPPRDLDSIMDKYVLLEPGVGQHMAVNTERAAAAAAGAGASAAGHVPPRGILIDVGGSIWGDRFGLPWLVNSYGALGVSFEHMYSWEAKPVTPGYWQGMPVDVKRRVHFYNMYASTEAGSPDHPWTILKLAARPEDFVVVKVDIDTPSVEMPLLRQILEDPSLAALIDELYFEHHVVIPAMESWWGSGSDHTQGSLEDSYKLFRALREAGIRAHSWP